jgi:hypothetical protein
MQSRQYFLNGHAALAKKRKQTTISLQSVAISATPYKVLDDTQTTQCHGVDMVKMRLIPHLSSAIRADFGSLHQVLEAVRAISGFSI